MALTCADKVIGCCFRAAICIFNLIYVILRYCGFDIVPLTLEKVIEPLTPEQKTEASRLDFSTPLEYFMEGFNRNPQISGFQRFLTLLKARIFVVQRATVKHEIQKNPDILKTPVENPLVIIGLPRSGTTMLQRMLSSNPKFLSPMSWELLTPPVPPGRPANFRDTERYKKVRQLFKLRDWLGLTEMDKKHKVGIELNEECLLILKTYFIEVVDTVPEGFEELRHYVYNYPEENLLEAYTFYKHYLQCVFYNNLDGEKQLLLKAPIHTLHLDTYCKVLPASKFIFTHRDFKEITASLCSLKYEALEEIGFHGDRIEHGKRVLEFYKHLCDRIVPFLKKLPEDSYIILDYAELMSDPLGAVKKIYARFGLTFTEEVENAMKAHMSENPKDKFGKHEYRLEEWGITEKDIDETFSGLQYYLDGMSIV